LLKEDEQKPVFCQKPAICSFFAAKKDEQKPVFRFHGDLLYRNLPESFYRSAF
jgi:hypothetical protein